MDSLLEAATDLVALLPPSRIEAIANRMRGSSSGLVGSDVRHLVTTATARSALDRVLAGWNQTEMSGEMLAGILIGAAHVRQKAEQEGSVELVWTGPTTPCVATRRTEQVLLDVIRGAEQDLFLVSFVAYDVPSVMDELNTAAGRGVELRVLLEAAASHGGSLSVNPIAMMRGRVPAALLYAWTDRVAPFTDGRVHAKVAVADGRTAFLTSANLTGHALEKNMEAGVVIRGGTIPENLRAHLFALIDTRIIGGV
jgi:phosphatidylserine/phosphatidylglycerophosphate/cardiolipin synthase-like enzyme